MAFVLLACSSTETDKKIANASEEPTAMVNTLTAEEKDSGWQLLFDGSSTDNWRSYHGDNFPTRGWKVSDGALIVEKSSGSDHGGGDIITKRMYGNFELTLDFMVTDSANSGILYLVQENEDDLIWHSGPEFQILDNQTYLNQQESQATTHHLTGDNYDLQSSPKDYTKPIGEWNTAKIKVDQGKVEHWLNGNKVVEYQINSEDWKALVAGSKFNPYPQYGQASHGHIGLQDHGHEVRFRNIKIREIQTGTPLFNGEDLTGWTVHGTEKWYVDDGNIVCESGPDEEYGYLATNSSYKDFDIVLEFKQEDNGNSGVFFRSSLEGTNITGWQAEVAPPGNDSGGIYESGDNGRGWLIKPDPAKDKALKMGKWNIMRIQVIGRHVTTWLNGQKMIELEDAKIGRAEGQIALQIHSGGGIKVRWRNLYLREL
jgi:hypothetical protein